MRAINRTADGVHRQFSCIAALVRLAACTQAASTQLNGLVRIAAAERLCVSVGADEFHALHAALDHVTDSIAATTTDTNHLDLCALVELFDLNHFDAHGEPPVSLNCSCQN